MRLRTRQSEKLFALPRDRFSTRKHSKLSCVHITTSMIVALYTTAEGWMFSLLLRRHCNGGW